MICICKWVAKSVKIYDAYQRITYLVLANKKIMWLIPFGFQLSRFNLSKNTLFSSFSYIEFPDYKHYQLMLKDMGKIKSYPTTWTQCSLVTPYGDVDLHQYCPR